MQYFLCLSMPEVLQGHPGTFGGFLLFNHKQEVRTARGGNSDHSPSLATMHSGHASTGTRASRYLRPGGLVLGTFLLRIKEESYRK